MKRKRIWISLTAILPILAFLFFVNTSRAGYETAEYEVIKKEGSFEIREYVPHKVVTTSMQSTGGDGSFGRLFQYISGKNEAKKKIAMTTPVFMPSTEEGKTKEMQFVIPAEIASTGAPSPSNSSVKVKSMSGGKYAVLRFSGKGTNAQRKEKLATLRKELEERNLTPSGNPIFAGYDPPWTPGPMRRNEVLLLLDS